MYLGRVFFVSNDVHALIPGLQIANPRVVEANSSFVSPNHASPPHMYSAGAAVSIQQSLQGLNDQLHQPNQHEVENQLGQLFCPYGRYHSLRYLTKICSDLQYHD